MLFFVVRIRKYYQFQKLKKGLLNQTDIHNFTFKFLVFLLLQVEMGSSNNG